MKKQVYDVVVVGGSLGGVIATLSAAKEGKSVLLVEETKWIGGQATSQAVPFDEHKWIEEFGCTKTYRDLRNSIREYYKKYFPLSKKAKNNPKLNPGDASVSRLSCEPRVILKVLEDLILPYILEGRITLLTEHKAVKASVSGDYVKDVTIKNLISEELIVCEAKYFLDATDTGELLPLTNTEYVIGAESRDQTGEPHALLQPEPRDMQPITWVAAVDYVEGKDYTIEKPEEYEFFKNLMQPYDKYPVLSWYGPDSSTGKAKKFGMFTGGKEGLFPLWSYRRIVNPENFSKGFHDNEITYINWPQNDYFLGNVIDDDDSEVHLKRAKQLTLSFIYWLQTEAPREDGGMGYPGIRLRPDVVGTTDGLAMYPYIRESRRIKSQFTITENMINANIQRELPKFHDTVGVGCYHIDLHITTVTNTFLYYNSWPFEIPLGAMIPIRIKNLIPSCKNIGTTHLTNGCFRLHPVEWNIGEVAGYLASFSIDLDKTPSEIRNDKKLLKIFQEKLESEGVELHWPEDRVHPI